METRALDTSTTTLLMRCGKDHPRTFPVPADASLLRDGIVRWVIVRGEHVRCENPACPTMTRSGKPRAMRVFEVTSTTTTGPCDARCMEATGHDCRCSCGGRNHGSLA